MLPQRGDLPRASDVGSQYAAEVPGPALPTVHRTLASAYPTRSQTRRCTGPPRRSRATPTVGAAPYAPPAVLRLPPPEGPRDEQLHQGTVRCHRARGLLAPPRWDAVDREVDATQRGAGDQGARTPRLRAPRHRASAHRTDGGGLPRPDQLHRPHVLGRPGRGRRPRPRGASGFIEVVTHFGGHPLGLRGDGLFAGFSPATRRSPRPWRSAPAPSRSTASRTRSTPGSTSAASPASRRERVSTTATSPSSAPATHERSEVNPLGFAANFAAKCEKKANSWEVVVGEGLARPAADVPTSTSTPTPRRSTHRDYQRKYYHFYDYRWRRTLPAPARRRRAPQRHTHLPHLPAAKETDHVHACTAQPLRHHTRPLRHHAPARSSSTASPRPAAAASPTPSTAPSPRSPTTPSTAARTSPTTATTAPTRGGTTTTRSHRHVEAMEKRVPQVRLPPGRRRLRPVLGRRHRHRARQVQDRHLPSPRPGSAARRRASTAASAHRPVAGGSPRPTCTSTTTCASPTATTGTPPSTPSPPSPRGPRTGSPPTPSGASAAAGRSRGSTPLRRNRTASPPGARRPRTSPTRSPPTGASKPWTRWRTGSGSPTPRPPSSPPGSASS